LKAKKIKKNHFSYTNPPTILEVTKKKKKKKEKEENQVKLVIY